MAVASSRHKSTHTWLGWTVGWTSFIHLKEQKTHISPKAWQTRKACSTYSSHIARAQSRCTFVNFAIFGFRMLGPSILGAWLSNTLADSSFKEAVHPEKNDGLDDLVVDDEALSFHFLAGIVSGGGGGVLGRCCQESRKEQGREGSLGRLESSVWKVAWFLSPSPAPPSLHPRQTYCVMTSTDSGFTAVIGYSQYLIMPKHLSKVLAEPMNINWKTSSQVSSGLRMDKCQSSNIV